LIAVSELLTLEIPKELDWRREIILYGKAPTWLYSHLVWRFHKMSWVACFNIQLKQAVVVSSNIAEVQPGDTIPINTNQAPGNAILICGAPDSGKSILSHALRRNLPEIKSDWRIFLHRANWDGEGNHTLENPDPDLAKKLKDKNKFKLHLHPLADKLMPEYFAYHAEAVKNIRQVVDLALVDVGGKAEEVKKPVIEQCTHYIIISRYPEKIQEWHDLCGKILKPLAVIYSIWEDRVEVLRTEPFLELVAGKWQKSVKVPEVLLDQIVKALCS
jgi:CRISPR-associated protein Csx3